MKDEATKVSIEIEVMGEHDGYIFGLLIQHGHNEDCYVIVDKLDSTLYAHETRLSFILPIWDNLLKKSKTDMID